MRFRTSIAVLSAAAIVLTIAPATSALTIYQLRGRPGKTIMAAIEGMAATDASPQVINPSYKKGGIYRSPASRAIQTICVRFRVWSSDPAVESWHVFSTWPTQCGRVKRGNRFRPRARGRQVEAVKRYRVTAQITWRTGKRLLGSEVLDYDKEGDYYCASTRCSIEQTSDGRAFLYFLA
ncbi:MAG TPA: hypothetical protein VLU96_10740 [Gaiellaceae bacterium]|nr:hypothetical protein [Gaiellaceae bacterium]